MGSPFGPLMANVLMTELERVVFKGATKFFISQQFYLFFGKTRFLSFCVLVFRVSVSLVFSS